jgi:uncharacterized protein
MNSLESAQPRAAALHAPRARWRRAGRHRYPHLRLVSAKRAAQGLRAAKARVLITGGPGVGKTTFVSAASDGAAMAVPTQLLTPLLGEAAPTDALDIGHITVTQDPKVELWLVGTPGDRQCWPTWDVLRRDPATLIGAVVLLDVRRLEDCAPALEYLRRYRVPYLLAVNEFAGAPWYSVERVLATLGVQPAVPVLYVDARGRPDVRRVLARLVEHSLGLPGPRSWDS